MSSNSSSNSGGWSGQCSPPTHPGDSGGCTITYSTPGTCSGSVCVNGNVSTYVSPNGMPSGGGVGFTFRF